MQVILNLIKCFLVLIWPITKRVNSTNVAKEHLLSKASSKKYGIKEVLINWFDRC